MQKEMNLYIIPKDDNFERYGSKSFILPLSGFAVGFEKYFTIKEINEYSSKYEVSVIINKFMHKEELKEVKNIIKEINNIKYLFVEDFAFCNFYDKEKLVIFPNHIISNYNAVNLLFESGYKNVVLSNELSIDELIQIKESSKSNIFYMYINKNSLMYSKRELVSNYNKNFGIDSKDKKLKVKENISNRGLLLLEEERSTCIFDEKTFCASKYLDVLKDFNLIINFNNISESDSLLIIENLKNKELYKLIDCDNQFLENKIFYKVGDLK